LRIPVGDNEGGLEGENVQIIGGKEEGGGGGYLDEVERRKRRILTE
jgi:hypothetical protein